MSVCRTSNQVEMQISLKFAQSIHSRRVQEFEVSIYGPSHVRRHCEMLTIEHDMIKKFRDFDLAFQQVCKIS